MIAVVGGGISGLALAHQLAQRGLPFTLFEATSRTGGVIRSGRVDDHLLEWGPQRARLTADFAALIDDLDLHGELITSPQDLPLFVYRDGGLRTVPFTPAAFLRSDILSLRGKLRLLLEPFTAGARDEEDVAGFFVRKLGREAYENIAGPLYGGLYASDPQDMVVGLSLRHALRELNVSRSLLLPLLRRAGTVAPPDACTFREGLETLTRALHARHSPRIRLNAPVRTIERSGAAWAVMTDDACVDAEHVVLTTPAAASAHLLEQIAPRHAAGVAGLHYNPLAVVHLHAATDLRGLGYQVSLAETLVTRGVTWNDSLFGRKGVYTAYLGGAANPWIVEEGPARAGEIAVREFTQVTGFDAEVLSVEQVRMPAWDRSWSAIESLALPRGIHVHANWRARPGIAGRLAHSRMLARTLAV